MSNQDDRDEPQLQVIARAPFRVYYEGPAYLISGANKVGKFDVLPGHADFFSVLVPGGIAIETEAGTVQFPISNGIIAVRNDEAMLFVNM